MATINTQQIAKLNAQLSAITDILDDMFDDLQKNIDAGGDMVQEYLDDKFEDISDEITARLLPIRQRIIDIFKAQYAKATEKLAPIKAIMDMLPISPNLSVLVEVVNAIIDVITAPYQPLIQFISEVIPQVLLLSTNIQKIVNYQPKIIVPPEITIPSLNINVPPIKASDITG